MQNNCAIEILYYSMIQLFVYLYLIDEKKTMFFLMTNCKQ